MNTNLRKDLVDSIWNELWEKNLGQYIVGEQTGPPYCPPENPCSCAGGGSGSGAGGPNGGGAGGGDGQGQASNGLQTNPGFSSAVNQRIQQLNNQAKQQIGPGKGPLNPNNGNNVNQTYNSRTGQPISSGGGAYTPGNNYQGIPNVGQRNATGGGAVGLVLTINDNGVSGRIDVDAEKLANEGASIIKDYTKKEPPKECAGSGTGGPTNPANGSGATGTTSAAAGSSQSTVNNTRPVNSTGSTQTTGNSAGAGGGRPAPGRSGTGGGTGSNR
jgi:hypothetical protein